MNYADYLTVEEMEREMRNDVQQRRVQDMADRCVGNVLDVGAGTGTLSKILTQRGFNVRAIDVKKDYVEHMRKNGINADVCTPEEWTLRHNGPLGEIDTVVMGELLEHLENPGVALYNAFLTARKKIVLSVPNTENINDPWHLWNVRWKAIDHLLVVEFEKK